jgi:hypothetical protein
MKCRLPVLFAAIAMHLVFPCSASADFSSTDWEFFKEIRVPQPPKSEYVFFQVDAEIYDGCRGTLDSLRIIDADGREIPYQLVTKDEREERETFDPKILNNAYLAGDHNSFVLDIGEERPAVNELEIVTSSENFMRRASVEGSNDQTEWNLLQETAYIFDLPSTIRSKHLRIEFPLSNFRYLRATVFDDGTGALEIGGAKVFKTRREEAETELWPMTILERTEDKKNKTTEIVLDAGYRGLPISQFRIDAASRNYHREIQVRSSGDQDEWAVLGTDSIFDYDLPQFEKTDNLLTFRENASGRYFRLSIRNYDDEPLKIVGISGIGLVRRTVLLPRGDKPHTVYFGNPRATAPRYDLAHHIPYIETENLPRFTLGPRQGNPGYVKPRGPWSEEHAYLLWVIMAVVIAVLGLLVFNLMRKTPPAEQ